MCEEIVGQFMFIDIIKRQNVEGKMQAVNLKDKFR
jgi:hypothetical protein